MNQKKIFAKGVLVGALIMLLIGASFVSAVVIARLVVLPTLSPPRLFTLPETVGTTTEVELFDEEKLQIIHELIQDHFLYYDEVEYEALRDGILSGFVGGLNDPYSAFFNREETQRMHESRTGQFTGIGVSLSPDTGGVGIEIIQVFDGTPAAEVGLQPGDILMTVDGREIAGLDLSVIVSWVRGYEGTPVVIEIVRDGEVIEKEIIRRLVQIPSVEYEMKADGVGYIRITGFGSPAAYDEFVNAKASLENQGMEGLIVDLRSNPGGSLDVVVNILRRILPEGPIVTMENRHGEANVHRGNGRTPIEIPLVVLVNQFSASASEIFAGAVQDYEVGVVVGVTTFGKGSVQQVMPLQGETTLQLTIAEYYTPLGRNINRVGIEPDVEVEFERDPDMPDLDNQLDTAMEVIREMMR